MKINILLFLLLFFTKILTFAGLSEDFHALKNTGKSLEPTGAICEEVTRLRFSEKYPEPNYRVITGITYSDEVRTIGELDLVVFDNSTKMAILIGEVKCWQNAKSGFKKAREQRKRFLDNVKAPQALIFKWLGDPNEVFKKPQFKHASSFISVAQAGTRSKGFDVELEYTLPELMKLREDIMLCQQSGECVKPN